MKENILSSGAEAIIVLEDNFVIKKRIPKNYRLTILDEKLRKNRTKLEKKILIRAKKVIDVPEVFEDDSNDCEIKMEFILGNKLSEKLNDFSKDKQKIIAKEIGTVVGKMHKEGIIHGDLTTSNMIYSNSKIYLIDFGLSKLAGKIEDKAVDLHLLKQAFEAKHFKNYLELFSFVKKGYQKSNPGEFQMVFERLSLVEKRGRYKRAE
jgi:TP53 regulating kinase and related kinases